MSKLPLSTADDSIGVGEITNVVLVDDLCTQQYNYNFNVINNTYYS